MQLTDCDMRLIENWQRGFPLVPHPYSAIGSKVGLSEADVIERLRKLKMAGILVRVGATVASLGVLLSLIVGVSRTAFAMAANRDMPSFLAAVHPRYRVPHHAEVTVGLSVAGVAAVADIRSAIGFSSFAVLVYYAITNAAAWTLSPEERRWPRALAAIGLVGCVTLAITLPVASVVGGTALLGLGAMLYRFGRRS